MYKCECGREFDNSQSFNGHKGHCKTYLIKIYGEDHFLKNQSIQRLNYIKLKTFNEKENTIKAKDKNNLWISEQHTCEKCGKVMTEKFGSGRFCSQSCAKSRIITDEIKFKISETYHKNNHQDLSYFIKLRQDEAIFKYNLSPKKCVVCNNIIPYEKRKRTTCSSECLNKLRSDMGIKSSFSQQRRSKNEIFFCKLCQEYFGADKVLHNEPIFNGWDADVILPEIKVAILWNGPWHYKQISHHQSLLQVQNRDKIKLKEISDCNYIPYIIKDLGKNNENFVLNQFNIFIDYLTKNNLY